MAIEQRYSIRFYVLMMKTKSEILSMIAKTYGDSSLKKTRAYEWFNIFKNNPDHVVKDRQRSERPRKTSGKAEEIRDLQSGKSFVKYQRTSLSHVLTSGYLVGRCVFHVKESILKRCNISLFQVDYFLYMSTVSHSTKYDVAPLHFT